jgi:pyruvate,water dikinase
LALVEGRSVDRDIKRLVQNRKEEFTEYRKSEGPSERFYTYHPYYRAQTISPTLPDPLANKNFGPDVVVGTPCCPGKLKKKCKVALNPNDDHELDGEILVTSRTDPGWVPIFPTISGLLIERGSILSHSAVVAREMGIPTVVGITDITKKVKTDDELAMDGSRGLVHLKGSMEFLDSITD